MTQMSEPPEPKSRTVEIVDISYQPSQAEIRQPIEIPEDLPRCPCLSGLRRRREDCSLPSRFGVLIHLVGDRQGDVTK